MSAVFIFTSYTASIVALLQSTSKIIQTLSDLLNSNMDLGVEDTNHTQITISQRKRNQFEKKFTKIK